MNRVAVPVYNWTGVWLEPEGSPTFVRKGSIQKDFADGGAAPVFLFFVCYWGDRLGDNNAPTHGPQLFAGSGTVRFKPWGDYKINAYFQRIGDHLNDQREVPRHSLIDGRLEFVDDFRWVTPKYLSEMHTPRAALDYAQEAAALINSRA
jgi:hypothetical protein